MKTGYRYHKLSGLPMGEAYCSDDISLQVYADNRIGVYEESYDYATHFVAPDGTLTPRTVLTGLTYPNTVEYGDAVIVSGLPTICYLLVNGTLTRITDGTLLVQAATATQYEIVFVGAYIHATITISIVHSVGTACEADARWMAIKNATPAQIETWITNNVTDLASARTLLKTLVLAVRALYDKVN